MSSQTVVIQTSDGKILDIFGNVDTTVVILDDFRIEINEIDAGKALKFFKMYLEHNKKRCGALYFKLPEGQTLR